MSSQSIRRRKAEIEDLRKRLPRVVVFRVELADVAGSAISGLLLSQLLYWSERTSNEEGWIYKRQLDWDQELFISRRELETARKLLISKRIIDYRVRGCPPMGFYKVNLEVLLPLLAEAEVRSLPSDGPNCPTAKFGVDGASICDKSPFLAGTTAGSNRTKSPIAIGRNRRNYKEAEITSDTTTKKYTESIAASCAADISAIQRIHPRPSFDRANANIIAECIEEEMQLQNLGKDEAAAYVRQRTRLYADAVGQWSRDERRFAKGSTNFFKGRLYRQDESIWEAGNEHSSKQRDDEAVARAVRGTFKPNAS